MSQAIIAHKKATQASLQEMSSTLSTVLGRVVTAYMVGIRTPKTITRWSKGEVATVRDRYSEERLLAAYQVVSFLQEYESDETIRAFFIGMNPYLNDDAPAMVLRDGRFSDVMGAARLLVSGGYA